MNWFKIGKLTSNSGLVWLCDPHALIHTNHAAQAELGLSYSNFIDYLEMKEKLSGQYGATQFNDNNGKSLGVCVQADPNKKDYDVWVRTNETGSIVEMRVAFDDSIPT